MCHGSPQKCLVLRSRGCIEILVPGIFPVDQDVVSRDGDSTRGGAYFFESVLQAMLPVGYTIYAVANGRIVLYFFTLWLVREIVFNVKRFE